MLPPIIVSGPPRSGTTFVQELLSSHSRIRIHGQTGIWAEFWSWHERLVAEGDKAAADNKNIGLKAHFGGSDEPRCRRIAARIWRDFVTGYAEQRPRWGWRAPWACANPDQVRQIETLWPDARWIVCLRDPFRAWQSQQATYAPDLSLEESLRRWMSIVRFAQQSDPTRVVLFQLDRLTTADAAERQQHVTRLFDCIGERLTPSVTAFTQRWPTIHHRPAHSSLSDDTCVLVLNRLPELRSLLTYTGYTAQRSHAVSTQNDKQFSRYVPP